MEEEIFENPETGTAGLSSAFQLVESTSSISISFGTIPNSIILFPIQKELRRKDMHRREESSKELLQRVIKTHRRTLDKLDEY